MIQGVDLPSLQKCSISSFSFIIIDTLCINSNMIVDSSIWTVQICLVFVVLPTTGLFHLLSLRVYPFLFCYEDSPRLAMSPPINVRKKCSLSSSFYFQFLLSDCHYYSFIGISRNCQLDCDGKFSHYLLQLDDNIRNSIHRWNL